MEEKIKNTIGKNKEGYGYKYTELAEINKYCFDNDIVYYQEVETSEINQKDYIITYISKDNGKTYTKHKGCQIVQAVLSGIKNPVQEYGSSLTYCRRYSLLLALGLATEDTDAQELSMPVISSLEDAKAYKLTWGKYAGKTLGEVDKNYLQWLLANTKDEDLKTACDYLIDHITQEDIDLTAIFEDLIIKTDTDRDELYKHYKVRKYEDMSEEEVKDAIKIMESKLK